MRSIILIISHKRPECITAKSLEKAGYNGEWKIIADDMDDTDYETLYPERVVRFSKQEYLKKTDTVDNFGEPEVSVYARNFCWDYARQNGYDVFGLLDDDITGFAYRYIENGKFKGKPVKDMSSIFEAYCRYVLSANFMSGGFIVEAKLAGGKNSPIVKDRFFSIPTNAYIINTHIEPMGRYPFLGTVWEDMIFDYTNNLSGRMVYAIMPVVLRLKPPDANAPGGCTEYYAETEEYIKENYLNIVVPSAFRWKADFKGHRMSHDIPRIIGGKWKKDDAG